MVSGVRIPLFPLGLGHSQELIQAFPGFWRTPFLAQAHTRVGPSALAGLVAASGRGAAVASFGRLLAARVRMAAPAPGCRCCPLRGSPVLRAVENETLEFEPSASILPDLPSTGNPSGVTTSIQNVASTCRHWYFRGSSEGILR